MLGLTNELKAGAAKEDDLTHEGDVIIVIESQQHLNDAAFHLCDRIAESTQRSNFDRLSISKYFGVLTLLIVFLQLLL